MKKKKLFVMYICIHIIIMTCHFACRSSQKYKKIENFILFPLSWKAAKKISQCQCMYTLFIFIVKVVLYKKKRVERQKKYFFTRLTFAFAILFIYSCLFDILNSKRDLFCRFHEHKTEKSLTSNKQKMNWIECAYELQILLNSSQKLHTSPLRWIKDENYKTYFMLTKASKQNKKFKKNFSSEDH